MRDRWPPAEWELPTIEDAVRAGSFLAGRPEVIVEQLKAVEKRYPGLDRVISQRIFQSTGSPEPFANQAILYRGADTCRRGRRNLERPPLCPQTVGGDGQ